MPNNNKVTFDEPKLYNQGPRGPRQSWPTKMILKYGLAKDAKQAQVVLIAIMVLAIIMMVIFWPRSNYAPAPQQAEDGLGYVQ